MYIVDHNRYLAVVCTEGCQDTEEGVILGIDVVDHNRYLAVVCTEGCQDTEEGVILGIDVIL